MLKYWTAPLLAAALSLTNPIPSIGIGSEQASACGIFSKKPCGFNSDSSLDYKGNGQVENMIPATICFSEWDDLEGGRNKWWGPTLRYRSGDSLDRPAVKTQCYRQSVPKHTRIEADSACVAGKILRTSAITEPGTYWVE